MRGIPELPEWFVSTLALLAFGLFSDAHAGDANVDACAAWMPSALMTKLTTDLPGYRLPSSTDAGGDRLKSIASEGDWPCPFVVIADFDGNGSLDRAVLMPAKSGTGARLVAAFNNQAQGQGQWQLSLSEDWPLPVAASELRPMEPGLYQRSDAIAQPVAQLDQSVGLQADFAGFRAGKPEGDYAIYAVVNGHWQKLTMSP